MQSCFVRVRRHSYVLWRSVWSELCIDSTVGLVLTKKLTNSDQLTEGYVVTERIYMFSLRPIVTVIVKGLYTRSEGQLHSSE